MSTFYHAFAVLAAWLGFGLLIAPLVGGILKDRATRQFPFGGDEL